MVMKRAAGVGLLLILFGGNAIAQHVPPLSVEDLLNARQFGSGSPLAFSPDGKDLVYGVISQKENANISTAPGRKGNGVSSPAVNNEDIEIFDVRRGEEKN